MRDHFTMQHSRHTERSDAPRDGRVVLFVNDHDRARMEALESIGGKVVGWVDGFYRVQMGEKHGR